MSRSSIPRGVRSALATAVAWAPMVVLLAVCSKAPVKGAGERCYAASECAEGMICDFGVDPWVCRVATGPADAAPPVDAPRVDAQPRPDAGPPVPDAAPPIDAIGDGDGDGDDDDDD